MQELKENRAIDLFVTYRFLRLLTTPFEKQDAFKYGIIDKEGKVILVHPSQKSENGLPIA